MQSTPKGGTRLWIGLLLCLLSVAFVLPLFFASRAAFPAADDFVYAVRTHAEWMRSGSLPHVLVDAFRYAAQIFRNWQGTFTGAFVMALNPMAFTWRHYGVHAVVLLLFSLGMLLFLLRALSRYVYRRRDKSYVPAAFVLWAASWMLLPDLREGLYWFNGAWFYTGTQYLFYGALALLLSIPEAEGRSRAWRYGLLGCLLVWIGLNNYVTAVLAVSLLFVVLVVWWRQNKPGRIGLLVCYALLVLSLLISVLAPGNHARLAADASGGLSGYGVGESLLHAMGQSFVMLGRHLFQTPLWMGALLVLLLGLGQKKPPHLRLRHVLALPVLSWLLLVGMLMPHLYTSGYVGPARVVNLYDLWIVLSSLGCAYALGGTLGTLLRSMQVSGRALRVGAVLLAMLLTGLLGFVQPGSYRQTVGDLASGALSRYRAAMVQVFEQLEAAQVGSDVVVALPEETPSMAFPLLSAGEPQWNEEAVAQVFGLSSARADKNDNPNFNPNEEEESL